MNQSELLAKVVQSFLEEGGSPELRIEALEVARNWISHGLLPCQVSVCFPAISFLTLLFFSSFSSFSGHR